MTIRLLVPFDGSHAARRAVELLAGYAGDVSLLAPLALNVQVRPVGLWPGPAFAPAAIETALLEAGRKVLAPALANLSAAGMIAARAEVRLGVPAESILREAAVLMAEAVVMGTRGAGALHGFALGSIALRVAHGEGPPVILVKPEDRLPATFGKRLRVLLAMDGSEPAMRAAERLVSLAPLAGRARRTARICAAPADGAADSPSAARRRDGSMEHKGGRAGGPERARSLPPRAGRASPAYHGRRRPRRARYP